jgi:hypothetical protein
MRLETHQGGEWQGAEEAGHSGGPIYPLDAAQDHGLGGIVPLSFAKHGDCGL